jgi:hypothetical protein
MKLKRIFKMHSLSLAVVLTLLAPTTVTSSDSALLSGTAIVS